MRATQVRREHITINRREKGAPLANGVRCEGMNTPTFIAVCAVATLAACHPPAARAPIVHVADGPPLTQLVGEGRLSAAAEYIELTIRLQSECYSTPQGAAAAADKAAKVVVTILAGAIDPNQSGDGVIAEGGITRPFSRYRQSGGSSCVGTFQKSTTLVLKTSKMAEFGQNFLEIQQAIFAATLTKPNPKFTTATTFATLEAPVPRLKHETRERLEQDALALAIQNARKKYAAVTASSCKQSNFRIIKFVESSPGGGRPIAYKAPTHAPQKSSALKLDDIWINKLLTVSFELERDQCTN